ncbi:hypothetical protein APHACPA_0053 [Rickettsia amblyommatis str. Ac/Pa]|uniref:Uncharacterized protein n=1 Tax=Rickettsia amblyommatis str. Ac/Pa TaxID=1359164 RepID=A0A0F3MZ80_RICAM|nr:hypothetical protein APHACPA_0053 [Rickettsia amblyommatis str. Ac/Pa]
MCNNGSTDDCSNKKETLEFLNLYISDPTLELYLSPHSIPVIGEIVIKTEKFWYKPFIL